MAVSTRVLHTSACVQHRCRAAISSQPRAGPTGSPRAPTKTDKTDCSCGTRWPRSPVTRPGIRSECRKGSLGGLETAERRTIGAQAAYQYKSSDWSWPPSSVLSSSTCRGRRVWRPKATTKARSSRQSSRHDLGASTGLLPPIRAWSCVSRLAGARVPLSSYEVDRWAGILGVRVSPCFHVPTACAETESRCVPTVDGLPRCRRTWPWLCPRSSTVIHAAALSYSTIAGSRAAGTRDAAATASLLSGLAWLLYRTDGGKIWHGWQGSRSVSRPTSTRGCRQGYPSRQSVKRRAEAEMRAGGVRRCWWSACRAWPRAQPSTPPCPPCPPHRAREPPAPAGICHSAGWNEVGRSTTVGGTEPCRRGTLPYPPLLTMPSAGQWCWVVLPAHDKDAIENGGPPTALARQASGAAFRARVPASPGCLEWTSRSRTHERHAELSSPRQQSPSAPPDGKDQVQVRPSWQTIPVADTQVVGASTRGLIPIHARLRPTSRSGR